MLWALKQEDHGAQAILGFAMRLCFKTTANRPRDNQGTGSFTYVEIRTLAGVTISSHRSAHSALPSFKVQSCFRFEFEPLVSCRSEAFEWHSMDAVWLLGQLHLFLWQMAAWMFCQSELLTVLSFWKAVRGEWFSFIYL